MKYIPQNNNYVIYDRYFSKDSPQTFNPQIQSKVEIKPQVVAENSLSSNSRFRPKSYMAPQKIE